MPARCRGGTSDGRGDLSQHAARRLFEWEIRSVGKSLPGALGDRAGGVRVEIVWPNGRIFAGDMIAATAPAHEMAGMAGEVSLRRAEQHFPILAVKR